MKILMTHFGTEPAEAARRQLESAGHQVVACDEAVDRGVACGALRGRACPLDAHPVDVAVHLRGGSGMSEAGTLCALRHFVPVVVASPGPEAGPDTVSAEVSADPFLPWATAVCALDELAEVVAPAAVAPLAAHCVVAQRAANAVLEAEGLPASFEACVRRQGGSLRVELTSDRPVSPELSGRAAVRAEGAIRTIDEFSSKIDVEIAVPTGP